MKKLFLIFVALIILSGCATNPIKFEPKKFEPPQKIEPYKIPEDPFKEPPIAIFLKKLPDGNYKIVSQDQAELTAYTAKEHNKIVLRITYYKELVPKLENFVNIHIQMYNKSIDLMVDQNLAKELYRELYVEMYNKNKSDNRWNVVEKGGLWAVIIGQLILLLK